MLFTEDSDKLNVLLDRLNGSVYTFRMRLAPLECKILLQDLISSKPKLVPPRKKLDEVERFSDLGRCASLGVVYQLKCLRACKRPGWCLLVWSICGFGVAYGLFCTVLLRLVLLCGFKP